MAEPKNAAEVTNATAEALTKPVAEVTAKAAEPVAEGTAKTEEPAAKKH